MKDLKYTIISLFALLSETVLSFVPLSSNEEVTSRWRLEYSNKTDFFDTDLIKGTSIADILPNFLQPKKKVVVTGATGQAGRLILKRLSSNLNIKAIGGVRDETRAKRILSKDRKVFRGLQINKVPAIDLSKASLKRIDLVKDSKDELKASLRGVNALIIATGFVADPQTLGNPFMVARKAEAIDNLGACKLMDAAKEVGVTKIVLLSSILTNARAWGQTQAPGYFVTNRLGNVLDQKLVAENYLRTLGVDYTIIRAAELKNDIKGQSRTLIISGEDTLNDGVVSREFVADICVAALSDKRYSRKLFEIKQE